MYHNYNIEDNEIQVLNDVNSVTGKKVEWKEKYLMKQGVVDSYFRISQKLSSERFYKRSINVLNCGNFLQFKRYVNDNTMKLFRADFCKDRLCPMCSWRRGLKIYSQVSSIMDKLCENKEYKYIFLTLTVKNPVADDLNETINQMYKSWNRFVCGRQFKKSIVGWYRALEITYNTDEDTFHPHFHCILTVNKSYFKKSDLYLNQEDYLNLWKRAMRLDYDPIVHVTILKDRNGDMKKSIAECAKYTVKNSDVVIKGNNFLTDSIVLTLTDALYGRRLIAFGGIMKEIFKQMRFDDSVDGDLVITGEEKIREDVAYVLENYCWSVGYNNYVKS